MAPPNHPGSPPALERSAKLPPTLRNEYPVSAWTAYFRPNLRKPAFLIAILVLILAGFGILFRDNLFGPAEHIVLSLNGSTSLADELVPQLAQSFLRDELGADQTGLRLVSKDARGHRFVRVWGRVPGRSGLQVIDIHGDGTAAAFKCLAAESSRDACDIGMASRSISERDRLLYPALRNLGDRSTEHVVALDAIAIIVNPANPVSQLSVQQLHAIYSGQITNWKAVGGNDAPIHLYGRNLDSGTFEMFTERVFAKDPQSTDDPTAVAPDHRIEDIEMMVDAVLRSPNAIGYVSFNMVKGAKALAISDGIGPAVKPTELSTVTQEYPVCRRLLLYHWDAPGSLINAFIRYAVYKPGQTLVDQTTYVELTAKVFPVTPPAGAPPVYKAITTRYSRIELTFHFSSEQTNAGGDDNEELNNLTKVNALRLRTFLAQHSGTGQDILLIGFSDGNENKHPTDNLARARAQSVATYLRAIGVFVPSENIRNFGADIPVASDQSPEGRSRNRRVEIWVRKDL